MLFQNKLRQETTCNSLRRLIESAKVLYSLFSNQALRWTDRLFCKKKMENLDWLEWEPVTTPLNFDVIQHGALPKKITAIELSRDTDLKLVAIGRGTGYFSLEEHINLRPGESASYAEETIGRTKFGALVLLRGVLLVSSNNKSTSLQVEDTDPLFIHAEVSEAQVFQAELPIVNQVEWIVNFSTDNYILGRCTIRERSSFFKRERSGGDVLERNLGQNVNGSPDHFRCECTFSNQKWSFIVGHVIDDIAPTRYRPGFLEFDNLKGNGLPSEDAKQTILAALSFALGRQLVSVGSTSLGKDGDRIGFTSREVYMLEENVYKQPSKLPTPIGLVQQEWCLDERKVSGIISAVASKMETINIEYPLFLVWLGLTSPLDVQAAHLGAAIESLRDSYCTVGKELSTLLVSKSIWKTRIKKPLIETFDKIIDSLEEGSIDSKEKEILRRKLEDLNKKSSNMQYEEFFNLLNIKVGKVELQALRERNRPAHGHRYKPSEFHKLSMTINALYSLFNRLVLKMTNASDCYIDYSTYGYPVRDIEHPLGGPEGDGSPAIA